MKYELENLAILIYNPPLEDLQLIFYMFTF